MLNVIIRDCRKGMKLSVAEAAQRSGLSTATIRSVESGQGTIASMKRLIKAMDAILLLNGTKQTAFFGVKLAEQRRAVGISQRTLAALIGCTQATIVAMERNTRGRMITLERYGKAVGIDLKIIDKCAGKAPRRLVPPRNAPDRDKVYTPRELAKIVINYHPLKGVVHDPCRGIENNAAFYDQFPEHVTKRWSEIDQGRDFLRWHEPVDWVVGNPPWSQMRDFLKHGMVVGDNVVYLLSFNHLSTKARIADIQNAGFGWRSVLFLPSPIEWPQSGFQIAAIWLQRGWEGPCDMKAIP